MKKSLLMILGCLLTAAMTFNACTQQENLVDAPTTSLNTTEIASSFTMTLPSNLREASAEEVQQFVESLSSEEMGVRVESSKIFNFLRETGKLDRLMAEKPDFDYLTSADLEKYAGRMLSHYNSYTPKNEGERGCVTLYSECNGTTLFVLQRCCYGSYCDYANLYYFNHPSCSGPPTCNPACPYGYECVNGTCRDKCIGVTCPTNYNCVNGACVYVNPCTGVNCPPGRVCQNGVCVYVGGGDCNPPCNNGFCDNGICCGGTTGTICP